MKVMRLTILVCFCALFSQAFASGLTLGSWHVFLKTKKGSAECVNPAFVAQAKTILRGEATDPTNLLQQNGCLPAAEIGYVDTPFQVVKRMDFGGVSIVEISNPQCVAPDGHIQSFITYAEESDINSANVKAPTKRSLCAEIGL